MGASCRCEGREDPKTEISVSVQKEPAKEAHESAPDPDQPHGEFQESPLEQLPSYNSDQVMLVQNAVRAFLTRKQQVTALQEVIVVEPVVDDMAAEDVTNEPELLEVPDLLSPEVKAKLEALGPYVYKLKVAGGHTRGPVKLKDGSVYIGQWLKGKRHGKGKFLSKDGGYLEGYWNGMLNLHGREIAPSGDFYEGGYLAGKKHGEGRFEDYKGENSYQGEWDMDKKHGKGVERISDGSTYEGQFENDEKSGLGVFKWSSGEVFEGRFKANVIDGVGKYVWKDNKWYEGEWQNGKMHGKGKFINEGKEYDGDFFEDKKNGFGIYKWEGNLYEGEFKDNKMHGKGYLTMKGKERKLYSFENNKRGAMIQEEDMKENQTAS